MGLTKRIGERTLFSDISFAVDERERVGLIARNGTGKSTLLAILAGEEGHDGGRVVLRGGTRVGYLRQSPQFPAAQTVGEVCLGHPDNLRTRQLLTQLGVDDMDARMGSLSGGMAKRVALARALEGDPDLLILDEPTNHLDVEAIEWLERYLARTRAGLLMVTHDRYLLDRVCGTIVEMDGARVYAYEGNYANYLQRRQERLDAAAAETARAANLYRKELEWMRRQPQARGHKARYREEAFYELEKVAARRMEERDVRLDAAAGYIGSKIFEAHHVDKAFGAKVILRDFNYKFARYEKMGVVGGNGAGKTTFVRLLLGLAQPDAGHFDVGSTVRFGHYAQEDAAFRPGARVIDVVRDIAEYVDMGDGRRLSASQFLQQFLFAPSAQYDLVEKLSGGERRRLHLCTVLMRSPNFLLLDEPTNDLDIATLRVLEDYLVGFRGCVIVVSHDRYFMDRVVDHLLVFNGDGDVRDFPGNYTQYRDWKAEHERARAAAAPRPAEKPQRAPRQAEGRRKLTFGERREMEQLERDIEALEAEKKRIEASLCSGAASVDDITAMSVRLPKLDAELDEKSMRWLELSEIDGQ